MSDPTRALLVVIIASICNQAAPAQEAVQPFQIIERGPHHRVWQSTLSTTNVLGKISQRTSRFVELRSGLHYRDNNEWKEADNRIEILPGKAVARNGQHQVTFLAQFNTVGAIDHVMPDGSRLRSRVLGLAYCDADSGKSVLIAQTKDSLGEVAHPDRVIYPDAFANLRANVQYTYRIDSLEQDIILLNCPPPPGDYGLNPETTRLEVWTEFFNPPAAAVKRRVLRAEPDLERRAKMAHPDFVDEQVSFPGMHTGQGTAFAIGADPAPVPVAKKWVRIDGRHFLVESIEYATAVLPLSRLPRAQADVKAIPGPREEMIASTAVPSVRPGASKSTMGTYTRQYAAASPTRGSQGFLIDYVLVVNSTNQLFRGDVTYYVSGPVNLAGTNTTFEGGAVIKYAKNANARLNISTPITFLGAPYRPVIFTAKQDQMVGESIESGSPSGYYAEVALDLSGVSTGTASILQHCRFAYAKSAVLFNQATGHVVKHAQLYKCATGIEATSADAAIRNVLFSGVVTNFSGSNSVFRAEHLTVDAALWVNHQSANQLLLTNSVLVNVTNLGTVSGAAFHTNVIWPFQTVGGGGYYHAVGSVLRDAGTPEINADLATDLGRMTTYPPQVLSGQISSATNYLPTAPLDTNALDIGYHYLPLDYYTTNLSFSAAVGFTNGVKVGYHGTYYGFTVNYNGSLASEGSPDQPNEFLRYSTVQEAAIGKPPTTFISASGPVTLKGSKSYLGGFNEASGTHVNPNSSLTAVHSEFYGGCLDFSFPTDVYLTNCLVERVWTRYDSDNGDLPNVVMLNCLFRSGTLSFWNYGSGPWVIHDCMLDGTYWSKYGPLTSSHNAFYGVTGYIPYQGYSTNAWFPGTSGGDVVLTNLAYSAGPFGSYYVQSASPTIFDVGSQYATNVTLFHFTMATNQAKEGSSVVDIGYHYVAANSQGLSVDSDADGIPDFKEDKNGNGVKDSGETDYLLADTDGDGLSDYIELLLGLNPLGLFTTPSLTGVSVPKCAVQ